MKQIDRTRLDMLIRVRAFGASHGQLFQTTSPAHAAFATIATEIDRLETLDVTERSATQAARVARKKTARDRLADTLNRAGATAQVLAKTDPTLDTHVVVPLPSDDLRLLTEARHFAASAAGWGESFAAHGIPLSEVEDRIAAFEQALQERGTGRDAKVKTRAEIDAAFGRAMDALAVLDVTVANCLAADSVTLAVWKHDRRIVYPSRGRRIGTPEPVPAPEATVEQPLPATVPTTAAA